MEVSALPDQSPLISPEMENQLQSLLAPVNISIICIAGEDEKSKEMVIFLRHIVRIASGIVLEVLTPGQNPEADRALDVSLLPATGFQNEQGLCRIAFHGVPGGQEMSSFISAVIAAAGKGRPLDRPTIRDIARIQKPANLQICVSLGCQHCAKLVMAAQRIALENQVISAHMIDANLYPQIVEKYKIQRVPVLLADGIVLSVGSMTLPELSTALRKRTVVTK